MSQEKAQLIAPIGHFTVPGLNVAGVVTATSFSGNCTGTASSITKGARFSSWCDDCYILCRRCDW